jgi:stage III sporulation protein AB
MILKIAGALGIFASSFAIGWYLSLESEYRAEDLKNLKNLLSRFYSALSFENAVLSEALDEIADDTDTAAIFRNFKTEIDKKSGTNIYEMWVSAVKKACPKLYFNSRDINELINLGKIFSYADKKIQLKVIASTIDYAQKEAEKAIDGGNGSKRVYRSLGAAFGLFAVILLF